MFVYLGPRESELLYFIEIQKERGTEDPQPL